jgi:nitrogen regulatory protein PII
MVPALQESGGYQTKEALMKRIEAVIVPSALDDFHRCARELGIFGFDLCKEETKPPQRVVMANECTSEIMSRLKVDFAVSDEETKPTVHAVLESVHPVSIAIFKFDRDTPRGAATSRPAILP